MKPIFITDRQIATEFKGGLTMASLMARHGVSQTCIEDSIRRYVNPLDPNLMRTEALGLVELVFSGSEEDRLQAAQRFREEYGHE